MKQKSTELDVDDIGGQDLICGFEPLWQKITFRSRLNNKMIYNNQ